MVQLTSKSACKRKHTYHSLKAANAARKRRNNNSLQSLYFAAAYQCNVCALWHLTTQEQELDGGQTNPNSQDTQAA